VENIVVQGNGKRPNGNRTVVSLGPSIQRHADRMTGSKQNIYVLEVVVDNSSVETPNTAVRSYATRALVELAGKPSSMSSAVIVAGQYCSPLYPAARNLHHADSIVDDRRLAVTLRSLTIAIRTMKAARSVPS
jgi:hypothetical protein